MLKTQSRTIGGTTYRVRQLGASQGRAMLVRLVQVLGPVLGPLMRGQETAKTRKVGANKAAPRVDSDAVAKALTELSNRLRQEDLDYICQVFGECTTLALGGDKEIPLDNSAQELHFAGKFGEMFQWLGFCLEVNFQDFFGSLKPGQMFGGLGVKA